MAQDKETCIIVGAGSGLSASLARLFSAENMSVVLAARDIQKLKGLREEINCDLVQCDVTNIDQVESLFAQTDQILGKPSVVVYNPSASQGQPGESSSDACYFKYQWGSPSA